MIVGVGQAPAALAEVSCCEADLSLEWINLFPVAILGLLLLACALVAGFFGHWVRLRSGRRLSDAGFASDGQEGYIVSGVLGLLALMLGFTLAMAVERFDTRRTLVLEEANAIGTTYLRAQLLGEPHRTRLSKLLVDYTENRIALATANRAEVSALLANNDRMLTDLWAATSAAFDSISDLDFSSSFVETMNNLIDLDAARKASRLAHVPTEVLVLLAIYIVVTGGVLGYVLTGYHGQLAGAFLITLLTFSLMLIIDLERPTRGGIVESQAPMELLRDSLRKQPPEVFDRWRTVQR
jgi:hypothetical protein